MSIRQAPLAAPSPLRLRFGGLVRLWPWLALLAAGIAAPWLFFDWSHGQQSGFLVAMLTQMGLMIIFALSFNMLMGQAGLLSFCHAVFLGLAGYATIHVMNAIKDGALWLPMELLPLASGLTGVAFAAAIGYVITRQRATAFAMITLGLGELVTAAAIMFRGFFGGEGGVTGDRVLHNSLLGLSYAPAIQVYYLVLAWTAIAVLLLALLTKTPLGRMANACRDNFERAQFVGYDPRMVRFYQVAVSGFFAGIAGGLYAVTYESVTYDAMSALVSGNAILMTFIGGIGVFWGPIVGAALITVMQSWVSLLSNSWQVYVGLLFIVMVIYAPGGIAGLILMHRPIWQAGELRRLAGPYSRVVPAALIALAGVVGLVELCSFVTIGRGEGKTLGLLGHPIDPSAAWPWLASAALLALGGALLYAQGRAFAAAWASVSDAIAARRPLR
jgi:branched-chain amino acid transport system permease protein